MRNCKARLTVALLLLALLALVACGQSQAQLAASMASPSSAETAPPFSPEPVNTDTVPPATTPPAEVACPSDWSYFDNPYLYYGMCYPPGWGFWDGSVEALSQVPVHMLGNLHLFSNEGFPWTGRDRKRTNFDAIAMNNLVDVELDLKQRRNEVDFPPEQCQPSKQLEPGSGRALWCEDTYESYGRQLDPNGTFHVLKVLFGLERTPRNVPPRVGSDLHIDLTGAALVVFIRSSTDRYRTDSDLLFRIARTIRAY